jgi:predicted ATP-dependent endonuclease of OLD family
LRLINLEVQGYRRLADVKVNLAGKVIAIVGPNEAGKTTLLHALQRLDSGDPVPPQDLSRATDKIGQETVYLNAFFELDKEDLDTFSDLDLSKIPVRMTYGRRVRGGGPVIAFHPPPEQRRDRFDKAVKDLTKADLGLGKAVGYGSTLLDDEVDDRPGRGRAHLGERLRKILLAIADESRTIDEALLDECNTIVNELDRIGREDLGGKLSSVVRWRKLPQEVRKRILPRIPRFLLFSDADRDLLGEYDLQGRGASEPPPALENVARLAQLNLEQFLVAIQRGDLGETLTMQNRANKRLAEVFTRTWRQSVITLELNIRDTVLRILIKENDERVTPFDERSAGLRMFVALTAFVETRKDTPTPPVLLIDEAEVHLHYDAQADLINMLMSQEVAAQVIYTTHSPGCLPPDLGTGIRVIAPAESGEAVSEVRNAFWADHNAGFSPLLLAMGAGAAAFSTTRYAVVAEGPSDMILLPSLIRAATGLDALQYQVAPGLSETPTSQYPDLDLHAAKVAFVVDGDQAGQKLRRRLMHSGVPQARIAIIRGMTLEDTVDMAAYRDAVHQEAILVNETPVEQIPDDRLRPPRASSVSNWYRETGRNAPSKIAVANRLVRDDRAKPSEDGGKVLRELHDQVMKAFGIDTD